MSEFVVDNNRNIAAIRGGPMIGGIWGETNPTAATWLRLMPNTNSAAKAADNPTGIDLGALRTDIAGANIQNWRLRVLTEGYQAAYTVGEYDATTEIAQMKLYVSSGNIEEHIARFPATFDVLYYPQMLLPLTLGFSTGAASPDNVMDIGYTAEDAVTPTNVVHLQRVVSGDQIILPIQEIDKLFYRYPTVGTGDTYSIAWGESYVA